MPIGSYLRLPAPTGAQIARQIEQDPLVASRYARLFHLQPAQVAAVFRHLRIQTLRRDAYCRVYYVRRDEHLGYRIRHLKRGAQVFILSNGVPVLLRACGNPLRNAIAEDLLPGMQTQPSPLSHDLRLGWRAPTPLLSPKRGDLRFEAPTPPEDPPPLVALGIVRFASYVQPAEAFTDADAPLILDRHALPPGSLPPMRIASPGIAAATILAWINGLSGFSHGSQSSGHSSAGPTGGGVHHKSGPRIPPHFTGPSKQGPVPIPEIASLYCFLLVCGLALAVGRRWNRI